VRQVVLGWRTLENAYFRVVGLKLRILRMANARKSWRTALFMWRTLENAYFGLRVLSKLEIGERAPNPVAIVVQSACFGRTDGSRRFGKAASRQ
jgi:hypothetical protein